MKGSISIALTARTTRVILEAEEDSSEGGVATGGKMAVDLPNEQWEALIFEEATRLAFKPQLPEA